MGCSARRIAALVLAGLGLPGCVTGHLLDAGRRRETPLVYRAASLDGQRLLLRYTALVTDDLGRPVGQHERRAAVELSDLRNPALRVEAFPVVRLADDAPLGGRPVALGAAGVRPPGLELEETPDGRHAGFVLDTDAERYPPFHSAALTTERTTPWIWVVMPATLVFDAVTNPVLLLFAPAVIVVGD